MEDPWIQWAKDQREGRNPTRAIADEVNRQGRAMLLETLVAVALAAVIAYRVFSQMGHGAHGVTLFATAFLTGWTGALAIALIYLRRGTFFLHDDSPRGRLDLSRRRQEAQMKSFRPMRIGVVIMGAFLAFWLPWITWFGPALQRGSTVTGVTRLALAGFLIALLYNVIGRMRGLTQARIDAIDSLLEQVDGAKSKSKQS